MEPFPDSSLSHFMTLDKSLYLAGTHDPPSRLSGLPEISYVCIFEVLRLFRRATAEEILVLGLRGIIGVRLCKLRY